MSLPGAFSVHPCQALGNGILEFLCRGMKPGGTSPENQRAKSYLALCHRVKVEELISLKTHPGSHNMPSFSVRGALVRIFARFTCPLTSPKSFSSSCQAPVGSRSRLRFRNGLCRCRAEDGSHVRGSQSKNVADRV